MNPRLTEVKNALLSFADQHRKLTLFLGALALGFVLGKLL